MRDLKEMLEKIHPDERLQKETLEKMKTFNEGRYHSTYKKMAVASICLLVCVVSIYALKSEKKENSPNDDINNVVDPFLQGAGNVEHYEVKNAKVIASPREYAGNTEESLAIDTEKNSENRISNPLTTFNMKTIPSLLQEEKNTIYSPLSLTYVLGMLEAGLEGTGKEQLENYYGSSQEELKVYLTSVLENNKGYEAMHLSNSIWIDQKHEVNTDTLQEIANIYDAYSYKTDFTSQKSLDEIHDYIYHETNEMISMQLEPNPNSAILLLNVIAVESKWSIDFQEDKTIDTFTLKNGNDISTSFIQGRNPNGKYLKTDAYEMTDIPLMNGFQLRVVLPSEDSSVSEIVADSNMLSSIMNKSFMDANTYDITIHLPKFKMESEFHMNELLRKGGVIDIYEDTEALKRFGEGLLVDDVFQKAAIDVNEKGLRAAVVSGVMAKTTGLIEDSEDKVELTLDRPFFYLIQDSSNNVIFAGTLYDPTI